MRVITVPVQEKFLFDLLAKTREGGLILQTTGGEQFMLLSLEEWKGFDVGAEDNFEKEVSVTAENKELMAFLAARRSKGKRIPMTTVKKQLGLH